MLTNKQALEKIMQICITNGFRFRVDSKAEFEQLKVTYRFPESLSTQRATSQRFYLPLSNLEIECVQTVTSMINAGDSLSDIENHISQFTPF